MFGDMEKFIKRKSEKNFLRMSNQRGFFNLALVNVTETHGKTVAFALIMLTTYVESLLPSCFEREKIHYNEATETLFLVLLSDSFIQDK